MELNMIEIPEEQARSAYEEYAAAVKVNRDEEDRAIAEGYKALAEGKRLIHLGQTLQIGGTSIVEVRSRWDGRDVQVAVPNLACCRADAKIAWTSGVDSDGGCVITADRQANQLHAANRKDRFVIADGTFERPERTLLRPLRAIVPNVPPRLRPKRGLQLYTLLWEAEWAPDPSAPEDPALLRRLGGELYIVLGTWDLTELERTVLSGRAN
jgi:hypothetical protein